MERSYLGSTTGKLPPFHSLKWLFNGSSRFRRISALQKSELAAKLAHRLGSPAFTPENTAGTAVTVVVVTTTVCPTSVVPVPSASALEASEQNAPASVVLTSDPAHPVEPLASDPARHGNNSFRKLNLKTFNKLPSLGAAKFERSGYYSAEEQKLDNLVFLGNHGRYGCSGISDK